MTQEAMFDFATSRGLPGCNNVNANEFFECDMVEHDSGAITGNVIDMRNGRQRPARIAGDGRIEAMPGLDMKAFLAWAEKQPRWRGVAALQQLSESRAPAPRG